MTVTAIATPISVFLLACRLRLGNSLSLTLSESLTIMASPHTVSAITVSVFCWACRLRNSLIIITSCSETSLLISFCDWACTMCNSPVIINPCAMSHPMTMSRLRKGSVFMSFFGAISNCVTMVSQAVM